MTRRNPFEEIEQLFERMSKQVETGDWQALSGDNIPVDVADTGEAIEVAADVPGYDTEDISITLREGRLTIEASRQSDVADVREEDDVQYIRRERHDHSISRSVRLPEAVEENEATARYNNGVLRITLPKVDPSDYGRQIDIE